MQIRPRKVLLQGEQVFGWERALGGVTGVATLGEQPLIDQTIKALLPLGPFHALSTQQPETMLKLARQLGGQSIYIPDRATPSCRLAVILGLSEASMVVKLVGRGKVDVPMCARALRMDLHHRIWRRRQEGASANLLSKEFGLHHVSIRRICRQMKKRRMSVKVLAHRSGE